MSQAKHITAHTSNSAATTTKRGIIRTLLIWNAAWREYDNLQRLDVEALRDMGLSETTRASITVSQIAARMQGRH